MSQVLLHMRTRNFTDTHKKKKKKTIFPAPMFKKLADVQQHYMQSFCTELYQNRAMAVQSTNGSSCTPSSGAPLSLRTLARTHIYTASFCKEFRENQKTCSVVDAVTDVRMSACGLHSGHSFCFERTPNNCRPEVSCVLHNTAIKYTRVLRHNQRSVLVGEPKGKTPLARPRCR